MNNDVCILFFREESRMYDSLFDNLALGAFFQTV